VTDLQTGILLLVLVAGLTSLVQALTDPRITRAFIGRSLRALGLTIAFMAVPAATLLLARDRLALAEPDQVATGVVLAVLGWTGLGILLLIRTAPRLRAVPEFWLRFGPPDLALAGLVALGVGVATGLV
jgi:hypothetical protein